MSDEKKDDDTIDLGKIKNSITGFFKKKDQAHHTEHPHQELKPHAQKSDDSVAIDFQHIKAGAKKHAKWIIPLLCILLAITISVYLRTMPQRMPIANDWAQGAVTNFYTSQLRQQIDQQYPNLPQQNKEALVASEWESFQKENRELLDSQTAELADQYRNNFKDDQGTLYLLGIDPYYYYRQTSLVLQNGYPGTTIKDGKIIEEYRLAPLGREQEWDFHPWFSAQWHRFLNIFGDVPLMVSFFFVGTIFSALTVIPGFFIGRRITHNNVGGFLVAMLLAVSSFFVARTTGESSDTDVYSVFFSVLIAWLFIEAMETKNKKWRWSAAVLAGLATGLFAFAWTGWWYIATFVVASLAFDLAYRCIMQWKAHKTSPISTLKEHGQILGIYLVSGSIFISLFTSIYQFIRIIIGPFQFLRLKAVAVTTFWPNIRTTVAELNVPAFSSVLEQLGGKLLLLMAIAVIIFLLFKKEENGSPRVYLAFFLALWLGASLFGTTKGVRFILQVTPVFAIAVGSFLGLAWSYLSNWLSSELKIHKIITKMILLCIALLFLIEPLQSGYSQAFNSVPSINDQWYNELTKIKKEAPKGIIITSWWDFGHWFKALADRPVTFDGGTQTPWGAYWVGKSLITTNEKNAVGIVRMLNCGQNTAFDRLDLVLNDTPKSIDILNEIVALDMQKAARILQDHGLTIEQADAVLQYTHCENPPGSYYITSEDMVGKAGVWGHFGSWNFKKAVMYQKTKNLERDAGIQYLIDEFNATPDAAQEIYTEIQTTDADRWISPWPGYISGFQPCQQIAEEEFRCIGSLQDGNFALKININTLNASFEGSNGVVPNSVVIAEKEGIRQQESSGQKAGFSIVLLPTPEGYSFMITDPLQAGSMFTKLFFLEGQGLKCFSKFSDSQQGGFRIITWKVDYQCQQDNKVFFLPQEEVHAAHILISTETRSDEEALAIIEGLRQNITAANFAEYASQYSEDPGSKQNGGDLGWFGKKVMVPEFEQAAFALSPGEISEPIKTQFGYHLIYVLETRTR